MRKYREVFPGAGSNFVKNECYGKEKDHTVVRVDVFKGDGYSGIPEREVRGA